MCIGEECDEGKVRLISDGIINIHYVLKME